ncbi:MAG: hypothetical protein OEV60_06445 [Actinomycetota bacterium]|nr:hypothetical protein [Actinomycetota bacterium]MDH5223314.1 hypothetical protein [Actinomycetota bacterium]MDH5313921.1 hypothetical protein [Actinomycetota bacterium]
MWVFPLLAAVVAGVFAGLVAGQYVSRRRPYQLAWAIALAMYAAASLAIVFGVAGGWTTGEFGTFWALGAVLNVPFLAGGELMLLVRNRTVQAAIWITLVFLTAYTISVLRGAAFDAVALAEELPSGKHVFGDGSAAHRLPQLISIPSYLVLLGGALWSAWRMRGRPERRERFTGTLMIALGATVIAGFGSAFAALGLLAAFSLSLAVGISAMFAGFLWAGRSSTPAPASASAEVP